MSELNDQLKDIFDNAEFVPSNRVWEGVEKALVKKKKNRGLFWMWQTYATAAAILFIGAFAFLFNQDGGQSGSTGSEGSKPKPQQLTEVAKDSVQDKSNDLDELSKPEEIKVTTLADVKKEALEKEGGNAISSKDYVVNNSKPQILNEAEKETILDESSTESFFIDLADLKAYRESLASQIIAFNARMNFAPFQPDKTFTTELKIEEEPEIKEFRVNGGLGTGSFNSGEAGFFAIGAESEANVQFSDALVEVQNGEEQVESVISVGAGVNLTVSKKLSLDAGLRLTNFRISSSSNAYSIENGASLPISATAPFDPEELIFVGDYNTTNTFQSVFLQTSLNYKVVSFGRFDLNSRIGVGLDYFFNYKLQGDLNFLSVRDVNLSQNDISPFSLSLIPGVGINYRLNDQFGIGVDASYRRFFSNSEVSVNGGTSIFGFGFSLNYLLNRN